MLFTEILSYLNVEPSYTEEELAKLDIQMPSLIGESLTNAKQKIQEKDLKYTIIGDGDTVVSQSPAYGQPVPVNGTVVLYTNSSAEKKMVKVPDLTGLTVAQATERAKNAGLNIKLSGNQLTQTGVVSYNQNIAKDTEVEQGAVITVYFQHKQGVAD